jgi:hypothetical protein
MLIHQLTRSLIQVFPNMISCFILAYVSISFALWGLWDMRPEGFLRFSSSSVVKALHPRECVHPLLKFLI